MLRDIERTRIWTQKAPLTEERGVSERMRGIVEAGECQSTVRLRVSYTRDEGES